MADPSAEPFAGLRADCSRCTGLCCVTPAFEASTLFAFAKPAGVPCRNLVGAACGVHDDLLPLGMRGCAEFDCFGAGQRVVADGRTDAFWDVRALHETRWYLTEVGLRAPSREAVRLLRDDAPDEDAVNAVLLAASVAVRSGARGPNLRGADLGGQRLTDLRGANLRGASLVGADLTGADLRLADVRGCDLRDARLHGADLSSVLFLTTSQVAEAEGDLATRLPEQVRRPAWWTALPLLL